LSARIAGWACAIGIVVSAGVSCSTTRCLEDGQYRLAKNKVEITNSKKLSSKKLESYIKQKANSSMVFGWNPFLVVYNWAGNDDSKLVNKVLHSIGTAPVVYDASLVKSSAESIERHLEYLGYYNSKVSTDTNVDGRKVDVKYNVTLGKRFRIGEMTYSVPEGEFKEDFDADTLNITVKSGDFLAEDALEKESARSAEFFRNKGYYGFSKNFYTFEADTLFSLDTADLVMKVNEYTRNESPEDARKLRKYYFGDVNISYSEDLQFDERILRYMNTIEPGALYREQDVNNTYTRYSALKTFSGVNVELSPRDTNIVDVNISLTPSKLQGFKVNLEGSTNSTGLIGISPQLSYFHKNIFHGGQWLNMSFLGNFQFMAKDRSIHSNELGVTTSLSFPEFLGLPNSLFKGSVVPRTEINASYNYQNRPEYTRNIISTSFGYSGTVKKRFSYQFYPLQLKIVRLYNLDEDFYANLAGNPFMRNAYQNHFDVGSGISALYTTNSDLNPKTSYWYVRGQFDLSGNTLSLFNNLMNTDEWGSRIIWGTPYSQYVRTELTFGNTFVFGKNDTQAVAMRLLGGVGYAYGNSTAVPFEKQFYSGGSNSMRGWQARALGPGSSSISSMFAIPSQTGDIKLEANLEYRFPLFWKLNGALFTDIGNIWTFKNDPKANEEGTAGSSFYKGSKFSFKNLNETIAADWGLGLRVDLNFLILRLDMGMKLYDPARGGTKWVGADEWLKKEGFAVHFGVGYPF